MSLREEFEKNAEKELEMFGIQYQPFAMVVSVGITHLAVSCGKTPVEVAAFMLESMKLATRLADGESVDGRKEGSHVS